LGGLFKFFKNLNKAPDELLVQQENFDTDLLDNVNIGPLNEEINFSITQEEILRYVCQASFCIVSRLQRHLVSTLLFVLFLISVLVYDNFVEQLYTHN
jgi:hypothetical protein